MNDEINCFADTLKILSNSAPQAVDRLQELKGIKKYLHVDRTKLLEEYISVVKSSNELDKKQLIVICGSSGDGKTHDTSYLKYHKDYKDLFANFKIIVDATESYNPTETSTDTLIKSLSEFSDENLDNGNKSKIILLINMGILSTFINTLNKNNNKDFSKFIEFINDNNILENKIQNDNFNEERYFQYISYSDYNMFELTEKGAKSEYMLEIITKITEESDENIIHKSYKDECRNCEHQENCVVKINYEILRSNETIKLNIIQLLIECIIKYKINISTRDYLDFIYSIIVPNSFNYSNDIKLEEYINQLLPNLIFNNKSRKRILDVLKKLDPLSLSTEEINNLCINFFTNNLDENDKKEYKNFIDIFRLEQNFSDEFIDDEIYRSYIRYKMLKDESVFVVNANDRKSIFLDEIYNNYVRDLYCVNNNNENNRRILKQTLKKVKNTIEQWYWNPKGEDFINIDYFKNNFEYLILKNMKFEFEFKYPEQFKGKNEDKVSKFIPIINLKVKDKDIRIEIDYMLYELIIKINKGYVINSSDRTENLKMNNYINKLIEIGNENKKITIIKINDNNLEEYTLELESESLSWEKK